MENDNNTKYAPALFVPLRGRWIDLAFEHFEIGKKKLYFYTDANIGGIGQPWVEKIYFKRKGENVICVVADFIEIRTDNPREFRLRGFENDEGKKYYYGFENLKWLNAPIELNKLQHYTTGKSLRNDAPRPYFIRDLDI